MYRIKEIQRALNHVVGWEQSYSASNQIEEELTQSESGLTFQMAHPLLTLESVKSIMPDDWNDQYERWDQEKLYYTGNKVEHDNEIWIAKKDSTNQEPHAVEPDGEYWKIFNPLSDYLARITNNGITTAVQTFMQMKQLDKENKSLLERTTFFRGAGRITAGLRNTKKIVGFEIIPVKGMGVTAQINRIGLQMTGATGTVRMYLFHSSQSRPIKTFDLDFNVVNGGFQWFNVDDCFLPYVGQNTNAGGAWYLVYNQDDLPFGMEGINVSKDWSRDPCGTCNVGSVESWRSVKKYVDINPFMVGASDTFEEYPLLWDLQDMIYTNTFNYGINCEISVGCDLTDFIIQQRDVFKTVIQRQVAVTALRTIAMNPNTRVNRNQVNVNRMDLLYEIDGNTEAKRPGGLGYDLKKAYEALNIDVEGLDRLCLSCKNRGIRFRSV